MTQYWDEFYMTDAKRPILDRYREVNRLLRQSYWAKDRDDQTMYHAIEYSHNYAVFETESDRLVGFARVITDYATVFYLCDVYVEEAFRGRGLDKKLVEWIVVHEDKFAGINGLLKTRDAKALYETFGFVECETTCMFLTRD
ncbi:MAG: GNAT family N-acetyltransferase [Acetatifactor sp.]|nr:GNAT family N-acetyltransferase [Acetatifactor sp.]